MFHLSAARKEIEVKPYRVKTDVVRCAVGMGDWRLQGGGEVDAQGRAEKASCVFATFMFM